MIAPAAPALDFKLKDLDGQTHSLAAYQGQTIFLNFWAAWCPPCRQEMPSMQRFFQTIDKKKYVLLAVNVGQDLKTIKNFARENGYTFPILLDQDQKVARQYRVQAFPTTFIIKNGKVIGRFVGGREWELKELLNEIKP